MSRHNDLGARVDQATGALGELAWDPKITRALMERRRRHLAERSALEAPGDTATIQARLAEARARQAAEESSSG